MSSQRMSRGISTLPFSSEFCLCLICSNHSPNASASGSSCSRIFWCRWMTSISFQRCDHVIVVSRTCSHEPLGMTRSVCWKSPPISSMTPPKGWSLSLRSRSVWSKALIACQCWGTISSHTMHFTAHIRSARMLFFGMQQTDTSDNVSIGILNMECAVCPPGSSRVAMPEDAVQRMIAPSLQSLLQMTLYRNVFPVPPCPWIMNIPPALPSTDCRILS